MGERIFLILALFALLVVFITRDKHSLKSPAHATIADNESLQRDADSLCVGDSVPGEIDPVGRPALSNMPWRRSMGIMPPLRTANRIGRAHPHHHNRGVTPLEVAAALAALT